MSVQVHRCRFMDTERAGISAIAFNSVSQGPKQQPPADLRMAIGRANGDIEIWSPSVAASSAASTANATPTDHMFCEFVIPGAKGRSVEDLCWVRSPELRLFSVGATDTVVEWDLQTGLPAQFVHSDAGIVWAISVSPDQQKLAAATETGHVIIYDVSEDGRLEFAQRLGGGDTSLACVTWVSASKIAAGGSDGLIRVWSLDQNRIVQTLKVDKQKYRGRAGGSAGRSGTSTAGEEETIVWALQELPGTHQLVSGDSNGFVKIWDTKTWSLHQSLQAHEGDVLCLAVNHNGTALFSSGLDQKIVQARLTSQDSRSRKWTLMNSLVAHTHDIRCMASYQTGSMAMLVSGGLEPGFVVSSITEFTTRPHRRVLPSRPGGANVEVTTADNETFYITEFSGQIVNIWRMRNGSRQLQATVRTSGDEFLTAVSFDPVLGLLAVGSLYQLKLFLVESNEEDSDDSKGFISGLPVPNWSSDQGVKLCKWAEPEKLVVVTDQDEVVVYDTNANTIYSEITDRPERQNNAQLLPYTNTVSLIAVEQGLVAVARHSRMIDVYTLQGQLVNSLPSISAEITSIAFRNTDKLVVAAADQSILEFDITSGLLTPWSKLNLRRMPSELINQLEPAVGIFSGVGGVDRVWLWAPSWLATIDFSNTSPLRKRRHNEDENDEAVVEELGGRTDELPAFWISSKYKPLFFAGALGNDVLISEREEKSNGVKKFWSNRRIQI